MGSLRKLASQTAIYGMSSIIGRMLNYLLVPIYTRVFITSEYGIVNEMYAYVSFLVVILTYGMETGFFRFSELEKDKDKVYTTTLISLLISSSAFILIATFFAQPIASTLRYPNNSEYVIWFALIVSLDALSNIPFAKLRAQNRPVKFATIKFINILTNIGLNLFFILLCPYMLKHNIAPEFVDLVYKGKVGVGYIFIANLISSIVTVVLLLPEIFSIKLKFDFTLWKKMMTYGMPLLIVGFAGIINETMDRILLKYLLPPNISMAQLGIYGACYKISIMMSIFIQAFRFAAEPFFFAQAKEKNAKELYAKVMNYFIIACALIFLTITLYIDIVKFFVGKDYYEGLPVVPILLLANLCLGIYFNLSIWYKLTGQTRFGAYLSVAGAVITLLLNFWWIPIFGYMGSAWATLICYASMMIASYFFGQKYYYVKYRIKRNLFYIFYAIIIYLISAILPIESVVLRVSINTLFLGLFIASIYSIEKKSLSILK